MIILYIFIHPWIRIFNANPTVVLSFTLSGNWCWYLANTKWNTYVSHVIKSMHTYNRRICILNANPTVLLLLYLDKDWRRYSINTNDQPNPSKYSWFVMLPKKATSSNLHCCHPSSLDIHPLWMTPAEYVSEIEKQYSIVFGSPVT